MRSARLELPDANKRVEKEVLLRAWQFAKPFRNRLLLYLLTILGGALLGALPPIVFKAIIDRAIPQHSLRLLALFAGAVLALTIGQSTLGVVNRYLSSYIGEGLIYRLRVALFDHIQRMSISFFSQSQTGALLSRLNNDVLGSQQTISTLASVVSDLATLAFTLLFMVQLSLPVTLASLVLVPAIVVLDRKVGGRLSGLARRQMQSNAQMSSMEEERFNVAGALLVMLFGSRRRESAQFGGHAAQVRDAGIRLALAGRIYFTALSLLAGVGTVAVYYLGGREVISGALSLGALVALAQYVTRLYSPLTDLASSRVNLLQALVSFERVFEVLDAPPDISESSHPRRLYSPQGGVSLERVTFTYPSTVAIPSLAKAPEMGTLVANLREHVPALVEFSLEIAPGELVALVGPSGAGKTTVTNLINRLYDPEMGRVLIDGIDLRELALEDLRAAVGVVSQDPHLFHDSVIANLTYVKPDASFEEVVEAAQAAQIHELISSLPEGYLTTVGERGYRLSGGEKQRLSIARVFLKKPKIVILDEATSSLDSENELAIQSAISEVLNGRTSLVIAHRLSTVLSADKIAVISGGRLEELGDHRTLIERGGLYARLYENQFALEQK